MNELRKQGGRSEIVAYYFFQDGEELVVPDKFQLRFCCQHMSTIPIIILLLISGTAVTILWKRPACLLQQSTSSTQLHIHCQMMTMTTTMATTNGPIPRRRVFFGHRFSFFVSLYGHKEFYEDFCISRFLCHKSDDDGGDVQLKSLRTWLVLFF